MIASICHILFFKQDLLEELFKLAVSDRKETIIICTITNQMCVTNDSENNITSRIQKQNIEQISFVYPKYLQTIEESHKQTL